jgi:hypothetical protein
VTDLKELPEQTWGILACNRCGSRLTRTATGADCSECPSSFGRTDTGALDLRLQRAKVVSLDFELGRPLLRDGFKFEPLERRAQPEAGQVGAPGSGAGRTWNGIRRSASTICTRRAATIPEKYQYRYARELNMWVTM